MDSTIFNRRALLGSGALVGSDCICCAERDRFGVCSSI